MSSNVLCAIPLDVTGILCAEMHVWALYPSSLPFPSQVCLVFTTCSFKAPSARGFLFVMSLPW